ISQHIDPQKHTDNIFNLMRAGALDFFEKPRSDTEAAYQSVQSILVNKIKALAYKASRYKS
ncbi:MAG: hypothetical protein NZL92_12405, partial [Gloeomargarita sp. SKYG116]|nr:hypothetical protein [Gloeomargarita sp. SKYG116]MDW8402481.1 hypothetical protein [Gloeomargarita sp. SKYGB_i_bin116]